jgi:hypothetical protein
MRKRAQELADLWLSGERLQVARELERLESAALALATVADICDHLARQRTD